MALYPFRRVTNRPTIIEPNADALNRTEQEAGGLRLAWGTSHVQTTLARTPPAGGRLTRIIAGTRVAGSTKLRGGRV